MLLGFLFAQFRQEHSNTSLIILPPSRTYPKVKWLKEIHVSDEASQNHYHFFDNRVLPSHVDTDRATHEGWWYKPEYLIYDLNINSAITSPAHGEVIPLPTLDSSSSYTLRGYAYTGGNRQIIRVEVSLDGGSTWELTEIRRPEQEERYRPRGTPAWHVRNHCWCFWSLIVDLRRLAACGEMVVRAWDDAQNTQPADLTWNVMGMMNNCWFRVHVKIERNGGRDEQVMFEHPTVAGVEQGGWMRKREEGPDGREKDTGVVAEKDIKCFSMEEVAKHNCEDGCWIVVGGNVYDATTYLNEHPGGADSILINAGVDSTEEFFAIHSTKAIAILKQYYIGVLIANNNPDLAMPLPSTLHVSPLLSLSDDSFLDPKRWNTMTLEFKLSPLPNIRLFRFRLPDPHQPLGLPVGKHVLIKTITNDGKALIRAYTPISSSLARGYMEFLIKIYPVNPRFPDGGAFTHAFDQLESGASVEVKGPFGRIVYEGTGRFTLHGRAVTARRVGMLCGGTGITPMIALLSRMLENDDDDGVKVSLLCSNRNEEEILMRTELDEMAARFRNRFRLR